MENNGEQLKLSANVLEVLKPIIYDMTRVDYVQRSYIVKPKSEPDWMRNAKRSCAHVILDSSGVPTLAVSKREDGCLYCDACGRKIATDFSKAALDKLADAQEIVNQALLFGLIYGMDAPTTASLISVKSVLPDVAQLMQEIIERVHNKQNIDNTMDALGKEYNSKYAGVYNNAFTTIRK